MLLRFKREIIAIILVICMLFTITAISAADNSTDVVSATNASEETVNVANDDSLGMENDVESLGETDDGSITALRDKILNAIDKGDNEVKLYNNYAYGSTESITNTIVGSSNNGIGIATDFTIDGQGFTINGNDKSGRIIYFRDSSMSLTLKNICFVNCKDVYGGAVYATCKNLEIINCTFTDCTATGNPGGSIYSSCTNAKIYNSTFNNNVATANNGGALWIAPSTSFEIINSTFVNNTGLQGGAVYIQGGSGSSHNIKSCIFINNSLTYPNTINQVSNSYQYSGSSIFFGNYGHYVVNNNVFINSIRPLVKGNNPTVDANYNWWGNTIDNKDDTSLITTNIDLNYYLYLNMEIDNRNRIATISLNNLNDGTTYNTNELPEITFDITTSNVESTKNTVNLDNMGNGNVSFTVTESTGVLTINYNGISLSKELVKLTDEGSMTALNAKIQQAITDGESEVKLYNDYIYLNSEAITNMLAKSNGNYVSNKGIGIGTDLTIDGQGFTITGKSSDSRIFYIRNDDSKVNKVTLKNINFVGCTEQFGSAIYANCNYLIIENCTFTSCTSTSNRGGAVYISVSNEYNITNSNFTLNKATNTGNNGNGGALAIDTSSTSKGKITNCSFIDNSAYRYGGAIYVAIGSGNILDVDKCIFIGNTASGHSSAAGSSFYGIISGTYTISNSILLDEGTDVTGNGYYYLDNNWWGNTIDNQNENLNGNNQNENIYMNNWLYLDLKVDNRNGVATVSLNNLKDGTVYDDYDLPEITLNIESVNATLNTTKITLNENGQATVKYEMTSEVGSLTISHDNIELTKEITTPPQNSFTSLKQHIEQSDEINLDQNYYFDSNIDDGLTNGIEISKSAVIDGHGFTIDAKGLRNIFYLNDETNQYTLTLKNIIFANATATNGAAVYFKGKKIEIENCTFIKNTQETIYIAGVDSTENKITKSLFINNTGGNPIIYFDSKSTDSLTINNSVFIGNDDITVAKGTGIVTANYNWWGNNVTNHDSSLANVGDGVTVDNWLYLNMTVDDSTGIAEVSLINLNDGNIYADYDLPEIKLCISAIGASATENEIIVDETGKADVGYSVTASVGTITASINDAKITKEVKFNDKGDFDSLQHIIDSLQEGDEYTLDKNYVYSDSDTITDGILIDKAITLNGNGFTVDAKGKSRIFFLDADNIKLNNISLVNGKAIGLTPYGGGAIRINDDYVYDITNCIFINNTGSTGGSIFSYAWYKCGNIVNCTFINSNSTYSGGAIYDTSQYVNIERCIFINSTVGDDYYGSAIYLYFNGKIINSIFLNNGNHDIIYSYNSMATVNYNWFGNNATNYDIRPNIDNDISITKWYFLDINANSLKDTAAITLNNVYDSSTGSTSVYENCNLPDFNMTVFEHSNLDIDSDKIPLEKGKYNLKYTLTDTSGLLTVGYDDNIKVSKEIIRGNFTILQELISGYSDNSVIDLDCDYTYNLDYDYITQGIAITKNNLTIDGHGHKIDAKGKSGIFITNAQNITFKNINFVNGNSYYEIGSAIYYMGADNANFNVENCTFENNTAPFDYGAQYRYYYGGGAIYLGDHYGKYTIKDSKFINNTASYCSGGAIFACIQQTSKTNININNCRFIDNSAYYGGAIFFYNKNVTTSIDYCVFINNSAEDGSALHLNDYSSDDNVVNNSIFLNNVGISTFVTQFGTFNFDNNWWGNNATNYNDISDIIISSNMPTTWLFLNASITDDELYLTNTSTIRFFLQSYNQSTDEVSEYDKDNLPKFKLTVSSEKGTIDKTVVSLDEAIAYTVTETGEGNIIAQYENVKAIVHTVNKGKSTINVNINPIHLYLNEALLIRSLLFSDIAELSHEGTLNYALPEDSIAKLSSTRITPVSNGTTTLTISYNDPDGFYDSASVEIPVIVSKLPLVINVTYLETGEALPNEIVLYAQDSLNLAINLSVEETPLSSATANWEDFLYEFNESGVATFLKSIRGTAIGKSVNGTATLKAIHPGCVNLTLYYKQSYSNRFTWENVTIKITILPIPTRIDLDHSDSLEFKVDDSSKINATLINDTLQSYEHLNYMSDNETVVSINSQTGELTANNAGTAIITVSYDGNNLHEACEKTVTVTVSKYDTATTVTENDVTLNVEDSSQITASVTPDAEISQLGGEIEYVGYDESIITVSPTGLITAVSEGTTSITVNFTGNKKYSNSSTVINVAVNRIESQINSYSNSTKYGDIITLNPSVTAGAQEITEGTITYYIGSNNISQAIDVGNDFYFRVDRVDEFNITAKYSGTIKYLPDDKNFTITSAKSDNHIVVEVLDVTYPAPATVKVTADVDDTYTVDINGTNVLVEVTDGEGTNTTVLSAGSYYANITGYFSDYYNGVTQNDTFTLSKRTVNVRVSVDDISLPDVITVVVTSNVDGTYTVDINGSDVSVEVTGGEGTNTTSLRAGSYYANVTFEDNQNNTVNSENDTFTVSKTTNHVEVIVEDAVLPGIVTVRVDADIDGMYTIDINGSDVSVKVTGGRGTNTTSLRAGSYYANVTSFSDLENYTLAATNDTFEVTKSDISIEIIMDTVIYGTNVTGSFKPDISGTYTITIADSEPFNVEAIAKEYNIFSRHVPLSVSENRYSISVSIAEQDDYYAKTAETTFAVVQSDTNFNATTSEKSYSYKKPVKFVIELPEDAEGSVEFRYLNGDYIGKIEDVTTKQEFKWDSILDVDSYAIKAIYSGDNNYNQTNRTIYFNVIKAENRISVDVIADTYPNDVIVKVNATIAGTYTIDINGTTVEVQANSTRGTAVHLAAGDYYANIIYSNKNYYGNTTNTTFTLKKADLTAKVEVGDTVLPGETIIKITNAIKGVYHVVINGDESKSLDITVGDSGQGEASIKLPAGENYKANATFSDTENYTNKIQNASFNINRAFNVVVITVDDKTLPGDVVVNVTATVPGIYTVDINGTAVDVEVTSNRQGSSSIHLDADKNYYATTTFENENYTSLIIPATFNVNKGENKIKVLVERSGDLEVNVKVIADQPGKYKVDINNTIKEIEANGEGINLKLTAGNYYANITGYSNESYEGIISNAGFTVEQLKAGITAEGFEIDVKANNTIDVINKPEDSQVTFKSSNESIAVVDANGNVNGLIEGTVTITISSTGSANYSDETVNITVIVKKISSGITVDEFGSVNVKETKQINILNKPEDYEGTIEFVSDDDSVAKVENAVVTGIKSGQTVIHISATGSKMYEDYYTTLNVIVNKTSANIDVENSLDIEAGKNKSIELINVPQDFDGTISFKSNDTSVAVVDETTGLITAIKSGTVNVTVKINNSELYKEDLKEVIVTVSKIDFNLVGDDIIIKINETQLINYDNPADYPYKTITFESSDESIVSVNPVTGKVKGLKNGTATIKIIASDSEKFNDNTTEITVEVNKLPSTILTENSIEIEAEVRYVLNPEIENATNPEFTLISSNSSVVKIVNGLTIESIKSGKANITVVFKGDDEFLANETIIPVTVKKISSDIHADNLELSVYDNDYIVVYGIDVYSFDGDIIFKSSDESIVSVGDDGNVIAVKGGTATITISAKNSQIYENTITELTVTVNRISPELEVDEDEITIDAFDSQSIDVSVDMDYDGNISYATSNASVVIVDENGKITAISGGSATITITASQTDIFDANTTEITVTVNKISSKLEAADKITLNALESEYIDVSVDDRFDGTITYSSSDDSIVGVDKNGRITALKGGSATITVSTLGSDKFEDDSVKVTVNVNKLDSTVSLDVSNVTVGENVTAIITTPGDGIVSITVAKGGKVIKTENISADKYMSYLVSNLDVGNYEITAKYVENDIYGADEITKEFKVDKIDKFEFSAEVNNAVVGQITNVTVTLPGDATGKIRIGDKTYDISGEKTVISLPIQNVSGKNTITVGYIADEDSPYSSDEITASYNVDKKESSVDVTVTPDAKAGSDVVVTVAGESDANVSVYVDGVKQTVEDGKVTIAPEAGNHTVVVVVSEDENYSAKTVTQTFEVTKNTPSITVNATDAKVGEKSKVTVNLTDGATGKVIVDVNGSEYVIDIENTNTAELVLDKAGSYLIRAKYMGDDVYDAKESEAVTVHATEKASSNITVEIPEDVKVGEKAVINVSCDNDEVAVLINGVDYEIRDGKVEFVPDAAGTYQVVVKANETGDYKSDIVTKAFTVSKMDASLTISVAEMSDAGSEVEITVSSESDGEISLSVDGIEVTLTEGKVILIHSAGVHTVIACAGETDSYLKATANAIFTVNKLDTPISVDANSTKAGESTTVKLNITDKATGIVKVDVNGTEYIIDLSEARSLEVVLDKAGSYDITAKYLGDDVYNPAESQKITITASEKPASDVSIDVPEIKAGENGEITISIPNATGKVSVIVDGAEKVIELDENGSAKYAMEYAEAGNHTVLVKYMGDENNAPATALKSFSVEKQTSDVKVEIGDVKVGENTTISIDVGDAAGNVHVIIDGVENTVPLTKGKANFTASLDAGEKHDIVIVYPGDETHASAVETRLINQTAFESELKDIVISGEGTVTALLADANGKGIANAKVLYKINGEEFSASTDDNGIVTIEASSNSVVEIIFKGKGSNLATNTSITLNDLAPQRLATQIFAEEYTQYAVDADFGERGGYFYVKLVDQYGNPLAKKPVKIGFNGKVYNKTTNASGWAKLQINLKQEGRYTFAIAFLGDEQYNSSFVIQNINILKKKTSISASAKSYKAAAKSKTYTVTLKTEKFSSIDGKTYLGSGKKITIKINGKTYTAKTDANGKAKFSLKIAKKGKFKAVISFAGNKMYASSTKSVIITIK